MKVMLLIAMLAGLMSCSSYTSLDATAFGEKIREEGLTLIDVRTPDEYNEGHIPGALNADWYESDFLSKVESLCSKDSPVAVYCRSGKRSAGAAKQLSDAGYTVSNLKGGFMAWEAAGKRITKYEVETFRTDSGLPVDITLIKHGSLELSYNGLSIQFDPVGEYGNKPTDYATEFPKADVILVTHEHGDHLDDAALKALTGDNTILILNQTSANQIGRGEVIGNGQTRTLPQGILLEAVPAYNTTPGRERFHPKGNGNGYVLTIDGLRVYVAGDTEYLAEMAELKDIDVAFLPVNQPYTMTVEQCVQAAKTISPRVLIPYHFSNTDLSGLPAMLPGVEVMLRQMQ